MENSIESLLGDMFGIESQFSNSNITTEEAYSSLITEESNMSALYAMESLMKSVDSFSQEQLDSISQSMEAGFGNWLKSVNQFLTVASDGWDNFRIKNSKHSAELMKSNIKCTVSVYDKHLEFKALKVNFIKWFEEVEKAMNILIKVVDNHSQDKGNWFSNPATKTELAPAVSALSNGISKFPKEFAIGRKLEKTKKSMTYSEFVRHSNFKIDDCNSSYVKEIRLMNNRIDDLTHRLYKSQSVVGVHIFTVLMILIWGPNILGIIFAAGGYMHITKERNSNQFTINDLMKSYHKAHNDLIDIVDNNVSCLKKFVKAIL